VVATRAIPPNQARELARQILAQDRYAPLSRRPGPIEQLEAALGRLAGRAFDLLISVISRHLADAPLAWISLLALVALVATGVVLAVHRLRRRQRPGLAPARPAGVEVDHFDLADRLTAAGDAAGAVHELALGVATVLSSEGRLGASPLTVRELFRRAGDRAALRPLLTVFEESFYGHHNVGEHGLQQAWAAARPYRGRSAA
jgi:hypothetical protein